MLVAYLQQVVELIYQLRNCSRHEGDKDDEHSHAATLKSVTALSTLLKCCSVKVLGLQLFLSIMLIARATSNYNTHTQVMTVLNHAGVCVSYTTAWKYLKKLTVESRYLDIVREEHWIWAYDNLNINLKVHHE